jgi:hypothetical protein
MVTGYSKLQGAVRAKCNGLGLRADGKRVRDVQDCSDIQTTCRHSFCLDSPELRPISANSRVDTNSEAATATSTTIASHFSSRANRIVAFSAHCIQNIYKEAQSHVEK